MSTCNHMVGLADAGESYEPVYKNGRDVNWGALNAWGHIFPYCPDCGEHIYDYAIAMLNRTD